MNGEAEYMRNKNGKRRVPSLRRHKASGRGYVELNGRHHFLGPYGAPETQQRYERILGEWLAHGRRLPVEKDVITVVELCALYLNHAQSYYRALDGSPTKSMDGVRQALKVLKDRYGYSKVSDFGPLALQAVRNVWLERHLSRKTINYYTGHVKLVFRWAASQELIHPSVYEGVRSVVNLKRGRSSAREPEPVRPAHIDDVEAVRPYVSRQIWALIQLQLLTAVRSGELVRLRPIDIDTLKKVWPTKLSAHKTSYLSKERTLLFGPKAQKILRDFMRDRRVDAFLFCPQEGEEERYAKARTHRGPSALQGERKTDRTLGDHYTTASYRRAVARACDKAGVPRWTPHQLRHNAATNISKLYGLEAAQVILGHSRADITQIYAERDAELGRRVLSEIG